MAKFRTRYVCQNCGVESPKWMGRCPSCEAWNTYIEEVIEPEHEKTAESRRATGTSDHKVAQPLRIKTIESVEEQRIVTPDHELNRVLGGGIVPGSITLIGGEPGIGKSTLLLQLAVHLVGCKILYVSGEESAQQIKMRADRVDIQNDNCLILTETNLFQIFKQLKTVKPDLCIINSIQTLVSSAIEFTAGTVSQIRECASELQRYAKDSNVPVILVGHITKDGNIAGPKILEHMVDTVLQFEGEHHHAYRLLRTKKIVLALPPSWASTKCNKTGCGRLVTHRSCLSRKMPTTLAVLALVPPSRVCDPCLSKHRLWLATRLMARHNARQRALIANV